jgi:hypothetical protein
MKKFITQLMALDPADKEMKTWFGPEVFAESWDEAQEQLSEKGIGYAVVMGEVENKKQEEGRLSVDGFYEPGTEIVYLKDSAPIKSKVQFVIITYTGSGILLQYRTELGDHVAPDRAFLGVGKMLKKLAKEWENL